MCQSMLSLNAGNIRQKQVTSNCYSKYPVNVQNTSLDLEKQKKKGGGNEQKCIQVFNLFIC